MFIHRGKWINERIRGSGMSDHLMRERKDTSKRIGPF